jgi:hypothetical protein
MRPATPRIMNKLKLLLPIIFPKTMSENPFKEAKKLTINSGADVPKATIVNPITRSGTLFFFANEEAPDTSQFAPKIRHVNPKTINNEATIIFYQDVFLHHKNYQNILV